MGDAPKTDAEDLARFFHETYERLAPRFGWETQEASRTEWDAVPESNKGLMIAVAGEVLAALAAHDTPPPADKPTPFQSTCDHAESLWGRCTACGRTWEQQARDRLVPGSAAHTFANYGVPHPERAEDGQLDPDDELLAQVAQAAEFITDAGMYGIAELVRDLASALRRTRDDLRLAGAVLRSNAKARSHGEVLATGELIDAVHVGDDVCLHVRLPAPEFGHFMDDLGAEVLVVLAPTENTDG